MQRRSVFLMSDVPDSPCEVIVPLPIVGQQIPPFLQELLVYHFETFHSLCAVPGYRRVGFVSRNPCHWQRARRTNPMNVVFQAEVGLTRNDAVLRVAFVQGESIKPTSVLLSKQDCLLCCCMVVRCRVRVTIVAIGVGAL